MRAYVLSRFMQYAGAAMAAVFLLAAVPMSAWAQPTATFNIATATWSSGTAADHNCTWNGTTGVLTLNGGANVEVTGTVTGRRIEVAAGTAPSLRLNNVSITGLGVNQTAIMLHASASLTLTLEGENTLTSGAERAGIQVETGSTLTIQGTGSLTATGGASVNGSGVGAGIGGFGGGPVSGNSRGNNGGGAGTVIINSGTVTASSIGGGNGGRGGNNPNIQGAPPSGGNGGGGGNVRINGGIVNVAHIGGGSGGPQGTGGSGSATPSQPGAAGALTLNGNTIVNGNSISPTGANLTLTRGILFLGNAGTVYGSVELPADLTVASAQTLTIPAAGSLTIPAGITLTNEGTVTNNGTLTNSGTVVNNGTVNGCGAITQGSWTGAQPLACLTATINLANNNPPAADPGGLWTFAGDVYTITNPATPGVVTVTGSNEGSQRRIVVAASATVGIALDNVSIAGLGENQSAITLGNGATVNLTLAGENTLTGGNNGAGIQAPAGTALNIIGTGSLTATGAGTGAGIGAATAGTLTMNGDVIVIASSVSATATYSRGIAIVGSEGTVRGSVALPADLTVSSTVTLNIPANATLTIPAGRTLTNNGSVINCGIINVLGTWAGTAAVGGSCGANINLSVAITNGTSGTGWTFNNSVYTINNGANVNVYGTSAGNRRLAVAENATASITLNDVTIQLTTNQPPILLNNGATVNLAIEGANTLAGGVTSSGAAGIQVPESASLTIGGTGSLTAHGIGSGAGIGGGTSSATQNAGSITINSGTVTATTQNSNNGAIGGGATYGTGGTITINGGFVTATSIRGLNSNCTLIMNGNGILVTNEVRATTTYTRGIRFVGSNAITTGNVSGVFFGDHFTVEQDITLRSGLTLPIAAGQTLTIPEGRTLTNNGVITNNGTIVECGTYAGTGTLGGANKLTLCTPPTPPAGPFAAVYGQTLSEVSLAAYPDWAWKTPNAPVGNVGDQQHTVQFAPENPERYNVIEEEVTVTVSKATSTASYTYHRDVLHSDLTEQTVDLTAKLAAYNTTDATLTYTAGAITGTHTAIINAASVEATTNGIKFTIASDLSAANEGNTAIIPVTVSGFLNYNDITVNVEVKITDKTVTEVTVTAPANIIYGQTLGAPSASTADEVADAIWTFTYSGETANGTSYPETATAPTLPGTYSVTATLVSATFAGTGESTTFTIAPKPLTWAQGVVEDKTYDGTTAATVATAPTLMGVINDDVATGDITGGTAAFTSANAGASVAVTATGYSAAIIGVDAWKYTAPTGQPTFANAAIDKANQTAPDAPTMASTTATSITLTVITGAEYSMDNGLTWQDSPTFSGLTPNTPYTFVARLKATDNHNASLASAASAEITTDMLPVYTVTWETDGGTPAPEQTSVDHGDEITEPVAMTKVGHTFDSWYSDAALTTAVTFPIADVTANTTLYAKWTLNTYTVTWNADGGTPVPIQTSVDHGSSITAPVAMTKVGYTFGGWYSDAALTIAVTFPIADVTANTTLYAKWVINTYTVTWNADGGTPVPTQTSVNHGSSITAPVAMTKVGYTFGGWYSDAALTIAVTFPIADVTANTTLYAKWVINTYTVTWNADGGTPVPTQVSVNHGSSITAPVAMTKVGYTFGGWYSDAALTIAVTFPIADVTANTTLYAKWTLNTFTVTLGGASNGAGAGSYAVGATVIVSSGSAPAGMRFVTWTSNNTSVVFANAHAGKTSFTMPSGNVTVTATWEENAAMLKAGPNTLSKSARETKIYYEGESFKSATLNVYDAMGNVVRKLTVTDRARDPGVSRVVGAWDLRDARGNKVGEGAYLIRGVITTTDGVRVRVSEKVVVR